MGKRPLSSSNDEQTESKRMFLCNEIVPGEILKDRAGKEWKLGKAIGQGAFGEIFLASDDTKKKDVNLDANHVAKIELHSNGPLFVEVNCYLRIGKLDTINEWKSTKNLKTLGIVNYVTSGSHYKDGRKYRFLILPRFNSDLESILNKHYNRFNLKTVLTIGLQLLDALEYIHAHGFVHADIKASNIVLGEKKNVPSKSITTKITTTENPVKQQNNFRCFRYKGTSKRSVRTCRLTKIIRHNLRRNKHLICMETDVEEESENTKIEKVSDIYVDKNSHNQVFLLDFGLACKFLTSDGEHKEYCTDNRKAHAGTLLFCSLDAHNGAQSRRSDLECLGYNMIYWLTGNLPWSDDISDCEVVKKKKEHCFRHIDEFLKTCFKGLVQPGFFSDYFFYLKSLRFDQKPDYTYCKNILKQGLKEFEYKHDNQLDFENKEGCGRKRSFKRRNCENNFKKHKLLIHSIKRAPLLSNVPIIKPMLRAKNKKHKNNVLNWSKILMDPEDILKSGKKVKEDLIDGGNVDNKLNNLNIFDLNPTDAMLNVYTHYREKTANGFAKVCKGEPFNLDGYTAAMMEIYNRIKRNRTKTPVTKEPRKRGRPPKKSRAKKALSSTIKSDRSSSNMGSQKSVNANKRSKANVTVIVNKYRLRG